MIKSEPQRDLYRKALLVQLESIYPQPCSFAELNLDMHAIGYKGTDEQDVLRECSAMAEETPPLVLMVKAQLNKSIAKVRATEAGCVIARS